jgi:hypothetical protein
MVPLDTAIDLSRPVNYRVSEGARFVVEYIKNGGFSGADAEPFELTYRIDAGAAKWGRGPVSSAETAEHKALKTRIEELVAERKSQRDIATLLGISIDKGVLPGPAAPARNRNGPLRAMPRFWLRGAGPSEF